MRTVAAIAALAMLSCEGPPPPSPRRPDAAVKPRFPTEAGLRNVNLACFPAGFVTTRVRVRGALVELCGVAAGTARCFHVDPFSSEVSVAPAADAPAQPRAEPLLEAPMTRTELLVRGGRAALRGGTLTSSGAVGARTAQPRQVGFTSLDNAVLAPWSDGWYVALIGIRAPDLGASAFVDPATGRMTGRAAVLPCDGGL